MIHNFKNWKWAVAFFFSSAVAMFVFVFVVNDYPIFFFVGVGIVLFSLYVLLFQRKSKDKK